MDESYVDVTRAQPSICSYIQLRGEQESGRVAYTFLQDPDDKSSYQEITYGQLLHRVIEFATRLSAIARPGERAILLYSPGLEYIVAFYSCLWAGLAAVPAYPLKSNQHRDRLSAVISDCAATVILTHSSELAKLQTIRESSFPGVDTRHIISEIEALSAVKSMPRQILASRTELALLQYTSGSTGDPKGVMVTHANLIHNLGEIRDKFGSTSDTVMVSWLPPYHDMGLISAILEPLFVGFHGVLMSPFSFIQRPMRWLKAISDFRATLSGGPNFAFDLVCTGRDARPADFSLESLRIMYSGAEPIQMATLQRFCDLFVVSGFKPSMFYPCYGLAEGTLFSSGGDALSTPIVWSTARRQLVDWGQASMVEVTQTGRDQPLRIGCGQTLGGQQIRIVNPDDSMELNEGVEGEIWLRGPSIAKGYWQREAQSLETFASFTAYGVGPFLRTGDLGFLVGQELFVTGRIKDTIIVRGKKYHPHDIERAVEAAVTEVRPACTVAFNIGDQGDIAVVAEIERTARKADPHALLAAIRRAVGKHSQMLPSTVVIVGPGRTFKTSSGKVQRRLTRKLLEQQQLEAWARWSVASAEDDQYAPLLVTAES